MASREVDEIIKRAEMLEPDERLYLIARLAEGVEQGDEEERPRRRWSEIYGAASHPLVGEDAQDWVSRVRRKADESRGEGFRRES